MMRLLLPLLFLFAGTLNAQIQGTFENSTGVLRADQNSFVTITAEYPMRSITVTGLDSLESQHIAVSDTLCYRVFFLTDVPARHKLVGGMPNIAVTSDSERYYWISRLAKEMWLYSGRAVVLNLDGSREEFVGNELHFWVEKRLK